MVAMTISKELNIEMRYKLRIIRVTIDGIYQMMVYSDVVVISFSIKYITLYNNNNYISHRWFI